MAFNAVNKAPGVYIDEIQVPGPIAGVSTSTAAFVGPAEKGPINEPTRLTNPTQFTNVFGGYISDPMVYSTHAVQAFFANGGTLCYFVRAGTGRRAYLDIVDAKGRRTLVVTAKQEGKGPESITVSLDQVSLVTGVTAVRHSTTLVSASGKAIILPDDTATATARTAFDAAATALRNAEKDLADAKAPGSTKTPAEIAVLQTAVDTAAGNLTQPTQDLMKAAKAQFQALAPDWRPGDALLLDDPNDATHKTQDRAVIERLWFDAEAFRTVVRPRDGLKFSYPPADSAATTPVVASTMRIADLNPGDTRIRLSDVTKIEPGSYVQLSQGTAVPEGGSVKSVDRVNHTITLDSPLKKLFDMREKDASNAAIPAVTLSTQEFTLTVKTPGVEVYRDLSIDPRHSRYFGQVIASDFVDVAPADPPSNSRAPDNRPFGLTTDSPPNGTIADAPLAGGADESISQLDETHYADAIQALERIDEVNILCIPDSVGFTNADGTPNEATTQAIQADMVAHCEKMQDRFAVLDPLREDPGATAPARIVSQREKLSSDRGYAALYYPWLYVRNPLGKGRVLLPPSGHVAGLYARVDDQRGVHKAPANEAPRGILGLELSLGDNDQGPLNEAGINVIRFFPGRGIRVWGARTIAPKDITQWRYVNVRRLVIYLEESIQEATQFAVFEPNEVGLWKKLQRQVSNFLLRVWQDGALFGATAEQAFRVRVDAELNPDDKIALGILTVEVIVRPTSPAEFVVFRVIADPTGNALIQE